MEPYRFAGGTAIVTGAASGIGAALAARNAAAAGGAQACPASSPISAAIASARLQRRLAIVPPTPQRARYRVPSPLPRRPGGWLTVAVLPS